MIIAWMAYAALFTGLVAAGALAVERVISLWDGARRFVWVMSLAIVTIVPTVIAIRPRVATRAADQPIERWVAIPVRGPGGATATATTVVASSPASTRLYLSKLKLPSIAVPSGVAAWAPLAVAAWAASSTLLFVLFVRELRAVRRRRAGWHDAEIDGRRVLVADDVGPAVVGAFAPAIVLPRWALALEGNERTLMMRHEAEHVAAGDPVLFLIAAIAIVLFPWNAALWFIADRLRLAIEIDCDARVLRAVGRPREYGLLLLAVGSRRTAALPLAVSLAERRPFLERRILAMTNVRPARPILASLPFVGIAGAAALVAAQTPQPASSASTRTTAETPVAIARPATATATATAATGASQAWSPSVSWSATAAQSASAPARSATSATPATSAISSTPGAAAAAARSSGDASAIGVTPATLPVAARVTEMPTAAATPSMTKSASDIPFEVIRAWIARYYPTVVDGSGSISLVTIVVDADEQYLSSTSDDGKNANDVLSGIPRDQIASVEVVKGAAAGALYGPGAANGVVVVTTKNGAAAAGTRTATGDGASVAGRARARADSGTGALPTTDIIRVAVGNAKFVGSDPIFIVDGVVVDGPGSSTPVTTPRSLLEKLGVPADGIQSVQVLKLPAGRIGPNPLGIVVVTLKRPG